MSFFSSATMMILCGAATGMLAISPIAAAEILSDTAPPPPRLEHAPTPRDGYVWSAGHWELSGHSYVWVSGSWITERRGARWIVDHWDQVGSQWHYVPGHWER